MFCQTWSFVLRPGDPDAQRVGLRTVAVSDASKVYETRGGDVSSFKRFVDLFCLWWPGDPNDQRVELRTVAVLDASEVYQTRSRGVTGTPGTSCSMNSFRTLSWTPGADEHQERGRRIEGEHVVTKPSLT